MPGLASTFQSDSLADAIVDIECGDKIGVMLATTLAGLGARLRMRGQDADALHALQTSIVRHWGRAEIAANPPGGEASVIRIFASAEALRAHIDAGGDTPRPLDIVILASERGDTDIDGVLADAAARNRRVQAIILSGRANDANAASKNGRGADRGDPVLAGLVTFLLSAAGTGIPNQCFRLAPMEALPPARVPDHPSMTVCAPAMASLP